MNRHASIELKNVSMRFGARVVLDHIDAEFGSERSYAILGPSGSGKTTLLALAGNLVKPTEGVVRYTIGGKPTPESAFPVVWITQTTNAIGSRTARENVAIGLLGQAPRWKDALAGTQQILERVGLDRVADSKCRHLSGGELQRVVIARALIGQPSFVLADEPTGQLDQPATERIAAALVEQRGCSGVIVATHDPTVAAACEVILHIRDGKLES